MIFLLLQYSILGFLLFVKINSYCIQKHGIIRFRNRVKFFDSLNDDILVKLEAKKELCLKYLGDKSVDEYLKKAYLIQYQSITKEEEELREKNKREEKELREKNKELREKNKREEKELREKNKELREKNKREEKELREKNKELREKNKREQEELREKNKELREKNKELQELWSKDPRSLFGPVNAPIPQVKPAVPPASRYAFLDRKEELNIAWTTMISNWEFRNFNGIKKHLIVTGQMFGSGKTTFGENLLNFDVPHIADEFDKLPESDGKESLRNARYVMIDFQKKKNAPEIWIESLDEWISYLIWVNSLETLFDIPQNKSKDFWRIKKYSTVECWVALQSLCNCPLYIHFDEVGELEKSKFRLIDKEEDDYISRLRIYYEFWENLSFSLISEGAFIYCTGKSFVLSDVGMNKFKFSASPSTIQLIYLSSFSVKDITDALRTSAGISECVNSSEINGVAQWLHEWTAGVPRFVYYGIEGIIKTFSKNKLTSTNMLDIVPYRKTVLKKMKSAAGSLFNDKLFNEDKSKNLLLTVLYAATSELIFEADGYLPGTDEFTVMELVDRFNIYVSKDPIDMNNIKLLLPRIWRENININVLPELSFLKTMDAAFVDKGKALEVILERMLIMKCNFRGEPISIEQALPFLTNRMTCVSNYKIGILQQTMLDFKIDKNTLTKEVNDSILKSGNGFDNVLLSFKPKSSSVDLCLLLSNRIIGFQCKNVEKEFSVGDLNSEMLKFVNLAAVMGDNNSNYYALFVLVLTGKGTEDIEKLRGDVYNSQSISSEITKTPVKIPEKMQLLILSENDMSILLGSANLECLRSIPV